MGWVSSPRLDSCRSEATTGSEYKYSRDGLTTLVGRKCHGELPGGEGKVAERERSLNALNALQKVLSVRRLTDD